jgi:hypothetical protein
MSFYRYLAAEMVLGNGSPETNELSVYGTDTIKKIYGNLSVAEHTAVRENGYIDKIRTILFKDGSNLQTSRTNNSNDISKIITYTNRPANVCISDILFLEEDLKLNKYLWHKIVESAITRVSILIKILNEQNIDKMPLIINDFPNIVMVLYEKPGIFTEEEK